ncbi:TrbI/VirB10 family protein [Ensifer sp. SL37]|uniref:TrbI/VirB10 family protein n=1 Tax=Ensifer sp. SL37 TaxID=2995137 RepID=UPI0022725267|nr:TrbI/VirB10 family protein [Ensifer sp. SL37]MCY1741008.1 conjugal transfer protein [Ensifer sp. SL37]
MTENPDNDLESGAARLAAEVQEAQKRNRQGVHPGGAKQKLLGAALFGATSLAVAVMFWPKSDSDANQELKTAEADQFQTADGSPFGKMMLPKRMPSLPAEPDPALLQQIAALQAELERLKNAPAPETKPDPEKEKQLKALIAQLSEVQKSLTDAQKANERALADRDLQLKQLQAQLDAARLQGGSGPVDTGAENFNQRRATSPMIAYGGQAAAQASASEKASADPNEGRRLSSNEKFAREQGKILPIQRAKIIANPSHTVMQGTMIQAALETAINTDLPGAIRAIVSEDVHSFDGSRVLIARGSRVIGAYSDNVSLGQRRAMVVWHRIIMPDNQTVEIGAYGGDAIGRSGVGGKVDTHFMERFGSAALISVIALAPSALTASGDTSETVSDTAEAMSDNMSEAMSNTLSAYLNRPSTIGVDQGSAVTIMVDRDLEIF